MNQQNKIPISEPNVNIGVLIKYLPVIVQSLRYLRKVASNIGKKDRG
ncbi:hypothetical protein [Desulfovibrio litoralis]|uniref:Uncharacterized protein n=1 Tax=Desulfovibrio litoralis DSM 11393 TaxID=1121455 RepID=A0A1M7TQ44_9BACT|nr:hypothetical protein [Desulfovibrio litoralis]SHN72743.1 hypothetical protein SAMN02745728_02346 [Desulfovibrio litoralis DSM 11393]